MPKSFSLRGKPGASSRQVDAVPVVLRTRLTEQDQRDLRVIWSRDQRIPTPASRQKWAHYRGLAPTTVGRWFSRRRDEAAPTGSYELNPSSPSNVKIPLKVCAYARARTTRGANFGPVDPEPSSDDTLLCHRGRLDQEANLAAAAETVISGEAPRSPCHGECVLCVSGALRISSLGPWTWDADVSHNAAPPSPPTLWFPWSVQAETAGQPHPGVSGTDALEMFTNSGL